jgi:cytochrome c oxidase subunit 4
MAEETVVEAKAEAEATAGTAELGPGEPSPVVHPANVAHGHPSVVRYVVVAIILAIVTAVEVGLYYTDLSGFGLVAPLMILALIKFAMVAAYFMHLRFDGRLLRRLFVTGIILAISVYTIFLLTLHVLIG